MRTLTQRELNRALIARQHLITKLPDLKQVLHDHIAIQAQEHRPPYVGLWARKSNFEASELDTLLASREVVRATSLRGTIQMSLTEDYHLMESEIHPGFKRWLNGYLVDIEDPDDWLPHAMNAISGRSLARKDIERLIDEALPGYNDGTFEGYALMLSLRLVRVPRIEGGGHSGPRDLWARGDEWTGQPYREAGRLEELVRRYLAAFGPADSADMQTWSGLSGLRKVFERMRPELVTYRNEDGYELFDVPDGIMADPETPVPTQVVAAYDSMLIGHADRSRVIDRRHRSMVMIGGIGYDGILADGWVAGTIRTRGDSVDVTLTTKLSPSETDRLEHEITTMRSQLFSLESRVGFTYEP